MNTARVFRPSVPGTFFQAINTGLTTDTETLYLDGHAGVDW